MDLFLLYQCIVRSNSWSYFDPGTLVINSMKFLQNPHPYVFENIACQSKDNERGILALCNTLRCIILLHIIIIINETEAGVWWQTALIDQNNSSVACD